MADLSCATTHCMRSGIDRDAHLRCPWVELNAATRVKRKHFDKHESSEIIEPYFEGVLAWLKADVEAESGTRSVLADELGAKALMAGSAYQGEVSPCEPKIVVEGTAADLFQGLMSFFQEGEESEVCEVDSTCSHFKAIVFYDFSPIDVDIRVFEVCSEVSFAVFSHPSRSDSVRLVQTLQLAAQHLMVVGLTVLQPQKGSGDSCLRLLDDDMSISDDEWCLDDVGIPAEGLRKTIQPLLHQACSGLQRKRQEAAAELALLAKATPAVRVPLAEALVEQPEVLKYLFSTGIRTRPEDALIIQYPAAAMLASIADNEAVQSGTAEVLMKQVLYHVDMKGDCSSIPRLVAQKLRVALGLLRCRISKLGKC